jgi:monoamine oxidase
VHNDVRTIGYWTGLVDDAPARGACGDHWSAYEAPDLLVEEVHRLLRLAYGVDARSRRPERPYVAVLRDWSAGPFGGGWHMWKIHEKSWLVAERMLQPVPGQPVYVCGEAYSFQQGWVEGALDRAEHMVQRIFGVPPRPDRGAG